MSESTHFHQRYYFGTGSQDGILLRKLYLSAFDTELFNQKKKMIDTEDIISLGDDSIRQVIRNIMTFKHHITEQNYYSIPTWTYLYEKGTRFYRVRKIDKSNFIDPPIDKIKNSSYLWNPPAHKISNYGRLNYPHESLLYTSHNYSEIAIKEMKITDQDRFALITYEAKEDIYVTIVGYFREDSDFTAEENRKIQALTDFFFNQFTKDISAGDEYLYKISSNLIKECYFIPENSQDGWVYPSVALKKGHNVCFKSENAKQKLELKGVEICKLDEKYGFVVNYVIEGFNRQEGLVFHLIGSDKQRELYPHLKRCK